MGQPTRNFGHAEIVHVLTVTDESELSTMDATIKSCSKVLTEAAVEFTSDEYVKSAARRLVYWKDKGEHYSF